MRKKSGIAANKAKKLPDIKKECFYTHFGHNLFIGPPLLTACARHQQ